MYFKRFLLPILAATVLGPTPAAALLLSLDDPEFGLDSITLDTDTDLEWLDIAATFEAGSWLDIQGELGTGGDFEGFRHATAAEIVELWENFGFPIINGGVSAANTDAALEFLDLFGHFVTHFPSGEPLSSQGFLADVGPTPDTRLYARVGKISLIDEWSASVNEVPPQPANSPIGPHFLVRSIPEPSVSALVVIEFVALVWALGRGWSRAGP